MWINKARLEAARDKKRKKVKIGNNIFGSLADAAKYYKMTHAALTARMKRGQPMNDGNMVEVLKKDSETISPNIQAPISPR